MTNSFKSQIPSTPAERKLLKKRKQKKLAENYDVSVNMKKIWETVRKSETTDKVKKKLCSSLYDQVKSRINQVSHSSKKFSNFKLYLLFFQMSC